MSGSDEPRIRHLPPGGTEPEAVDDVRPAVPRFVAIAAGSIVVLVILAVFGLGGVGEPVPTSTTQLAGGDDVPEVTSTSVVLPPTLSDLLGNDVETLGLVVAQPDLSNEVWLWFPDTFTPREYDVAIQTRQASFDTSGKFVAFATGNDIWVAGTGRSALHPLEDQRGFAWHPFDEGTFAYATPSGTGTAVVVGRVGALPVTPPVTEQVALVPGSARLLTWGPWGYTVAIDDQYVLVLDAAGQPSRAAAARVIAAGGSSLVAEGLPVELAQTWAETVFPGLSVVVSGWDGVEIVDETLTPVPASIPVRQAAASSPAFVFDDTGRRYAYIASQLPGSTSVNVIDLDGRAPRVIAFRERVTVVGFVRDGQALAVVGLDDGGLMIVDAGTGATSVLPIDDAVTILDVAL